MTESNQPWEAPSWMVSLFVGLVIVFLWWLPEIVGMP